MYRLSDAELIEELENRLDENKRALHDLRIVTQKLNDVNKKLQESEALKSNFLSNIRNEIVNPLSSIMALAIQAADDYKNNEELRKTADMIHSEAFNLDMQLRNIFTAAEIEAGELSLMPSRVDVVTLVQESIKQFGNNTSNKNIKVGVNCRTEGCKEHDEAFATDSEKLQIILMNLICNAIEFSPEGKSVDITVTRHDKTLTIDVRDYGPGFTEDQKEHIFDRFRQLSEGMSKLHRGHGLGLSITKALVEFLHGSLGVVSSAGGGSTFSVMIPVIESGNGVDIFSDEGNKFIFEGDEEVL